MRIEELELECERLRAQVSITAGSCVQFWFGGREAGPPLEALSPVPIRKVALVG